jgi:hypothetical protein
VVPKRVWRLLLAFPIAAALPGCGGDGDQSDKRKVREVATGYFRALDLKDGAKACGYLTPALRKKFVRGREDCSSGVMSLRYGPNMKSKIDRVEVSGDRAIVEATARDEASGSGYRDRLKLVRAGSTWKIRGVPSTALPGPG